MKKKQHRSILCCADPAGGRNSVKKIKTQFELQMSCGVKNNGCHWDKKGWRRIRRFTHNGDGKQLIYRAGESRTTEDSGWVH